MVMRARGIKGSLSEAVTLVWGLELSVGACQSLRSRDAKVGR